MTVPVTPKPVEPVVPPKTEEQRQAEAKVVADTARAAAAAASAPAPDAIVPVPPTKPDGVPDKFWDAKTGAVNYKAWGEAHAGLETKFHEAPKPGEPPAADTREGVVAAANAEFAKDGKLSEVSYTALAKHGYSKEQVDNYVAGQLAQTAPVREAAHGAAEGKENYEKMTEWASTNLEEADIIAFNAHLASKNPAIIKKAVEGVYAKYKAVVPVEGQRVNGQPPPSSSSTYQSKAEMTAAVADPRYAKDANYRAQHQKKMDAARKAGINLFL